MTDRAIGLIGLSKPAFALASLAGGLSALWQATPSIYWIFFVSVAIDFATGTLAAFITGQWSSGVGTRGLARKVLAMFGVAMAALIAHAGNQYAGFSLFGGVDVPLGEAFAAAFTLQEAGSTLENLHRGGVPLPGVVKRAIAAIRDREE